MGTMMNKISLTIGLLLFLASSSFAAVKTTGSGDSTQFDTTGFPAPMKSTYDTVMKVKCVKCHNLERVGIAIKTGIAPITGQPFDKSSTKAYGIKMMRKPDANMNKEEVKAVVELMNYLLDESLK